MRAVIAYAITAAITLAILLRRFGGRIEAGDKQSIEYPEGAGVGIITACILFVLCVLAAVAWPLLPVLWAVIWAYQRGVRTGEHKRNCGEGGSNHLLT